MPERIANRLMPERIANRLFCELFLPDETKKVRQQVRQVAERDIAPHARDIGQRDESVESFPWEPFRALADAGLFRLPLGPRARRRSRVPGTGGGHGREVAVVVTVAAQRERSRRHNYWAFVTERRAPGGQGTRSTLPRVWPASM